MRADSFAGHVVAVLSRRVPAFQPETGEPWAFPERIQAHRARRRAGWTPAGGVWAAPCLLLWAPGSARRTRARTRARVRVVIACLATMASVTSVAAGVSVVAAVQATLFAPGQHPTLLAPIAATASSHAAGHPPAFAIDGRPDTAWTEGAQGAGIGESLTIDFGRLVEMDRIRIWPGSPGAAAEARPALIRLTSTDGAGSRTTGAIRLRDSTASQDVALARTMAWRVTITVVSVYPELIPTRGGRAVVPGTDTSIAEVQFFGWPP